MQTVITAFYQAIGARNPATLQRVALPSATVLFAGDHAQPVLVPLRTMTEVPERRNQGGGVRVVRTDLRTDGDVAVDRIVVVSRSRDGLRELEAADILSLARRDGEWRIAQITFGPWKTRTAP